MGRFSATTNMKSLTFLALFSASRHAETLRDIKNRCKTFVWRPLISRQEAQILKAHKQLNQFLAVGNPDIVAAFADSLDSASLEQIEAIAQKLKALRKAREEKH